MGSTLTVDNIVGATTAANVKLPQGSIVQTVEFNRRGQLAVSMSSLATITSNSYVDIMSKAIVTKFANSKIYIQFNCILYESSGNTMRLTTKILRNSTEINGDQYGGYMATGQMQNYNVSMLDSPSVAAGTTLTYKMQAAEVGNGTVGVGYGDSGGGSNASIILMEIAQ